MFLGASQHTDRSVRLIWWESRRHHLSRDVEAGGDTDLQEIRDTDPAPGPRPGSSGNQGSDTATVPGPSRGSASGPGGSR